MGSPTEHLLMPDKTICLGSFVTINPEHPWYEFWEKSNLGKGLVVGVRLELLGPRTYGDTKLYKVVPHGKQDPKKAVLAYEHQLDYVEVPNPSGVNGQGD